VFLCASSPDESGIEALDFAVDDLVEDFDELIVLRCFDPEDLAKDDHDHLREQGKDLMRYIQERNSEFGGKKISIIVEFVAGRVTDTIRRLLALYRPDSLIVGTRGQKGMIQTWGAALGAPGMGSISRYCLSQSPVPVIVVRPERKVQQSMEKRRADPKWPKTQFEELSRSKSGSSLLNI